MLKKICNAQCRSWVRINARSYEVSLRRVNCRKPRPRKEECTCLHQCQPITWAQNGTPRAIERVRRHHALTLKCLVSAHIYSCINLVAKKELEQPSKPQWTLGRSQGAEQPRIQELLDIHFIKPSSINLADQYGSSEKEECLNPPLYKLLRLQ